MPKMKCPKYPIDIPDTREIVICDNRKYPWKPDKKGYFLVALDRDAGLICCGFVKSRGNKHRMAVELRGSDPDKIIREIAERKLCSLANMGYVASELMIAKDALDNKKKYVQR
jgi:hypothetical protein